MITPEGVSAALQLKVGQMRRPFSNDKRSSKNGHELNKDLCDALLMPQSTLHAPVPLFSGGGSLLLDSKLICLESA